MHSWKLCGSLGWAEGQGNLGRSWEFCLWTTRLFYYSSFLGLTKLLVASPQLRKCTGIYLGIPSQLGNFFQVVSQGNHRIHLVYFYLSGITIPHYLTSSVLKPLLHIFYLVCVCHLFWRREIWFLLSHCTWLSFFLLEAFYDILLSLVFKKGMDRFEIFPLPFTGAKWFTLKVFLFITGNVYSLQKKFLPDISGLPFRNFYLLGIRLLGWVLQCLTFFSHIFSPWFYYSTFLEISKTLPSNSSIDFINYNFPELLFSFHSFITTYNTCSMVAKNLTFLWAS